MFDCSMILMTASGFRRMRIGESSPLYETHSCLHENDGARLDRSLMTMLVVPGETGDESDLPCRRKRQAIEWPSGPGFYRLVRKFFTACKLHTIFCSDRETYFPARIHVIYTYRPRAHLSFLIIYCSSFVCVHDHFFIAFAGHKRRVYSKNQLSERRERK